MNRLVPITVAFLSVLSICALLLSCQSTPTESKAPTLKAPRISKEKLKKMLGDSRLVLIDTRTKQQWNKSKFKLPGAMYKSSWKVKEWGKDLSRDRLIVTYCS